jgi:hypothetical protein
MKLAAGNLTEIKNIFQLVTRDKVIRGLPYWPDNSWHSWHQRQWFCLEPRDGAAGGLSSAPCGHNHELLVKNKLTISVVEPLHFYMAPAPTPVPNMAHFSQTKN